MKHFYTDERVAVFIDGMNLYGALRALGFEIDFRKLNHLFASKTRLLRNFYYATLPDGDEYSPVRPLIDWLQYNGYSIITRPVRGYINEAGQRKVKGGIDMELAVDALELAPHLDHIVLVSGDGSFRRLVEALQKRGLRTTVISTAQTQPLMISDELRRQADFFVDLADLRELIARPQQAHNGSHDEDAGRMPAPDHPNHPQAPFQPPASAARGRVSSFAPTRRPAE